MADKQNLLIDTDIGDDVDDSLALALAVRSPEFHIAGVTTVFRQTDKRAQLARKLLDTLGAADIPIHEGRTQPLAGRFDITQPPCQWRPAFAAAYEKNALMAEDFIIQVLEQDASLILIALGPLTNIAAAARKAPDILRGRKILMMGGAFDSACPEWNFQCDPEAVGVVLSAGADIVFFGLELTSQCRLGPGDIQRIGESAESDMKLLSQMIHDWTNLTQFSVFLHDLAPLCALLHPEWFALSPRWIDIERIGEKTRGTAVCVPDYFGNQESRANAKTAFMAHPEKIREIFLHRVLDKQ